MPKISNIEVSQDGKTIRVYYEGIQETEDFPAASFNNEKYKVGADVNLLSNSTEATSTSTSSTSSSSTTKPPTASKKASFDIPDKYRDFFGGTTAEGKRIIKGDISGKTIQEKEEFRDWLDDNKLYDKVIQNSTKGYEKGLFYGGLGPEDFEYEYIKEYQGKSTADEYSPQERRDLYFKFLKLDDKYLGQGPEIYNDPEFRKEYLKKYKEKLPQSVRQLDDDKQLENFGYDHLDFSKYNANAELDKVVITPGPKSEPEAKKCPCTDKDGKEFYQKPFVNSITGKEECPPCPDTTDMDPGVVDDTKYFPPDVAAMVAAGVQRDDLRLPALPKVDFDPGDYYLEDYTAQVAGEQSGLSSVLNTIENTGANPALQAALATSVSGDSLNRLNNIISGVQNRNINRANQYSQYASNMMNTEQKLNEQLRKKYIDEVNLAKDNFQAFKNQKVKGMAESMQQPYQNIMDYASIYEVNPNASRYGKAAQEYLGADPREAREITNPWDAGNVGVTASNNTLTAGDYLKRYNQILEDYPDIDPDVATRAIEYEQKQDKYTGSRRRRRMSNGGNLPNFGAFLTGGIFE